MLRVLWWVKNGSKRGVSCCKSYAVYLTKRLQVSRDIWGRYCESKKVLARETTHSRVVRDDTLLLMLCWKPLTLMELWCWCSYRGCLKHLREPHRSNLTNGTERLLLLSMPMPKRINRSPVRWATKWKLYARWSTIRARCANPTNTSFGGYWWRGIKLCEERKDYFKFEEDMIPDYSELLTIDRIDNDWDYCKENCRWADMKTQSRNTRGNVIYKGKCLAQRAEELGVNYSAVYYWYRQWVREKFNLYSSHTSQWPYLKK